MSATAHLETLRRIPDDIVLSMATRGIDPHFTRECVCGWAAREALGIAADVDAQAVTQFAVVTDCADAFGGEWDAWLALYVDASHDTEAVEVAFVTRVMEAAGVARR